LNRSSKEKSVTPAAAAQQSPTWIKQHPSGCILTIKVVPGARKIEICHADSIRGEFLKIRIQAPPVEGQANEALVRFLADLLQRKKNSVQLLKGQKSRGKCVLIDNISVERCLEILGFPGYALDWT